MIDRDFGRTLYPPFVSALPVMLPDPLARRLAAALDIEGNIPRALDALGPLAGRDVAWVDGAAGGLAGRLPARGAGIRPVSRDDTAGHARTPKPWADALVAAWSAFRGFDA